MAEDEFGRVYWAESIDPNEEICWSLTSTASVNVMLPLSELDLVCSTVQKVVQSYKAASYLLPRCWTGSNHTAMSKTTRNWSDIVSLGRLKWRILRHLAIGVWYAVRWSLWQTVVTANSYSIPLACLESWTWDYCLTGLHSAQACTRFI